MDIWIIKVRVIVCKGRPRKATPEDDLAPTQLYQQMIGSLLYAAITSRPDISYAVGVLGRYASAPSVQHMTAAKRLLRYLLTNRRSYSFHREERS
jgi:hypothetical protein